MSAEIDPARFPTSPGVYLFRDDRRRVVYVGKARNLRQRLASYFRGGDGRLQVPFLQRRIADVETLVTRNEKEALILENNLIKQYKPRYNVRLKDDKSYVSVKITEKDAWPRILVTRRIVKDGSRYFGPFSSAASVRESVDSIRKAFPLRSCSDTVFRNRSRPCLEYQIRRCPAPCCLDVDPEVYRASIESAAQVLQGRDRRLLDDLRRRMEQASEAQRFEDAARLRDQIRALEKTREPQEAVSHFGLDQDAFGVHREGGHVEVQILLVRRGKMTGSHAYGFADSGVEEADLLAEILGRYYGGARDVPDEVLLPWDVGDESVRSDYLSEIRGKKARVSVPRRGEKRRIVEMAAENARQAFLSRKDSDESRERMLADLRTTLGLRSVPKRIECVDISNFQGSAIVGSIVALDEGVPDRSRYRRYRLRHVTRQDDFASLDEVLSRRLRRALERGDVPDLLVVDGGKAQLAVAERVVEKLGVEGLELASLAKDRVERDPRASELRRSGERAFRPGRDEPIPLPKSSGAAFLLERARDEAHRFAISYNRLLRRKAGTRSRLDAIPGVGPARRRALLRRFGSVAAIAEAGVDEIAAVPGVSSELAERVHRSLSGSSGEGRGRLRLSPVSDERESS